MRVRNTHLQSLVRQVHRKRPTRRPFSIELAYVAQNRKVSVVVQPHMRIGIGVPPQHRSDTRSMLVPDWIDQRSILKVADPDWSQPLVVGEPGSQEIPGGKRNPGCRKVVELQVREASKKVRLIWAAISIFRRNVIRNVSSRFNQHVLAQRNCRNWREHRLVRRASTSG